MTSRPVPFRPLTLPALALVGTLALAGCPGSGDLEFTALFENAKGVGPEAAVVYRGLAIGEVRSVDLDQGLVAVRMRVDEEHADQVCSDAVFRIDESTTPSQVKMIRAPGECVLMTADATVRGSEGRFDTYAKQGRQLYEKHADAMRDQAEEWSEKLEEWSKSPEAVKMRELAEALAEDAEELSRLGQEEFEKRWPEIEERFDDLLDELRNSGQGDDAADLESELEG